MMIEPDLASTGSFECSNDLFNRIHETTRYTLRTQNPCLDLGTGEAREKSPYGRIVSNWKREGEQLTMDVTIPANTTATTYVPAASMPGENGPAQDAAGVTESGRPAARADGVKWLRMQDHAAVYAVDF